MIIPSEADIRPAQSLKINPGVYAAEVEVMVTASFPHGRAAPSSPPSLSRWPCRRPQWRAGADTGSP